MHRRIGGSRIIAQSYYASHGATLFQAGPRPGTLVLPGPWQSNVGKALKKPPPPGGWPKPEPKKKGRGYFPRPFRFARLESGLAAGFTASGNSLVQVPRFPGNLLESFLARPLSSHPNCVDDRGHDGYRICRLPFHPRYLDRVKPES
jgi:hypothetical protein